MVIRVDWVNVGHKLYHVYEASDYFVEPSDSTESQVRLVLDNGKHDMLLSGGDVAWIMNNDGKTIDTIRT